QTNMKVFATLAVLSLVAHSAHAWCMNGRSPDAINVADLKDDCGRTVYTQDAFVLYDENTGNYIGAHDEGAWLTLTKDRPAGFRWYSDGGAPRLIGLSTDGAVGNMAWLMHNGRFLAPNKFSRADKGGLLEFRKWDEGRCKSKWCYQVGFLSGDQPVNGALANYGDWDSDGCVHLAPSNCKDKRFKWVLKTMKFGTGYSGRYNLDSIAGCSDLNENMLVGV
ncbi:hypothetical protein BGZ75_009027, partial [Mortierella antarctica]